MSDERIDQQLIEQVLKNPTQCVAVLEVLERRTDEAAAIYKAAALEYAKSVQAAGQQKAEALAVLVREDVELIERIEATRKLRPVAVMAGDPDLALQYEEQLAEFERIEAEICEKLESLEGYKATGSAELYEKAAKAWENYREQQLNSHETARAVSDTLRAIMQELVDVIEEAALARCDVFGGGLPQTMEIAQFERFQECGVDCDELVLQLAAELPDPSA